MTKAELNRYKALLEAKQAELVRGLRNREGITIQKSADTMDEIQLARERELVVSNLDRESSLLRDVRSALGRIVQGCYGDCLNCEVEISAKRLKVVPWTAYCIRCQEAADRHELKMGAVDHLLAGTAQPRLRNPIPVRPS
jgi:DnaK suppressor protein